MNKSTARDAMQITIQSQDGYSTPVWITYLNDSDCKEFNDSEGLLESQGDTIYTAGFYWAVCHPGCIPDSDFSGPFASESVAESDAKEWLNS
jgi:hypothetical protein